MVCCRPLNPLVKAVVVVTAGVQEDILLGHSHSDVSPSRENPTFAAYFSIFTALQKSSDDQLINHKALMCCRYVYNRL